MKSNLENPETSDQQEQELAGETSPEEMGKIYNSIVELDLTFEYAATEIQKIARGFMVRNNFNLIATQYLSSRPHSASSVQSSSIPSRPTSRPASAVPLEPPSETENADVESDHMVWKIIKDESATAIQALVRGRQTRQKRIFEMKRSEIARREAENEVRTIWNASQTYVAAIQKSDVTILDEFMNEKRTFTVASSVVQTFWSSKDTFNMSTMDGNSYKIEKTWDTVEGGKRSAENENETWELIQV